MVQRSQFVEVLERRREEGKRKERYIVVNCSKRNLVHYFMINEIICYQLEISVNILQT